MKGNVSGRQSPRSRSRSSKRRRPVGPQPKLIWQTAPVEGVDAEQVLAGPRRPHEQEARQQAVEFLQQLFADATEVKSKDVRKAATEQGISRWALDQAREQLGIRAKFRGFGKDGHWVWVAERKTAETQKEAETQTETATPETHKAETETPTAETQTSISSISAAQNSKTSGIPATSTEMLELQETQEMLAAKTSGIRLLLQRCKRCCRFLMRATTSLMRAPSRS